MKRKKRRTRRGGGIRRGRETVALERVREVKAKLTGKRHRKPFWRNLTR